MSIRIVTSATSFAWDGGQQCLSAGQMIDVPPSSSLESAIGLGNLTTPADPAAAAVTAGASN